jgi:hypothetical protein
MQHSTHSICWIENRDFCIYQAKTTNTLIPNYFICAVCLLASEQIVFIDRSSVTIPCACKLADCIRVNVSYTIFYMVSSYTYPISNTY